jgi:hypothetical protein
VAASAQDAPQTVDDSSALVPEAPLTAEESAMLGNALVFDPCHSAEKAAAPAGRVRQRLRHHPHGNA